MAGSEAVNVTARLVALVVAVVVISIPRLVATASDSCVDDGDLSFSRPIPGLGCGRVENDCVGGVLRICENLVWKIFCDKNWTRQDAAVACRTLGYSSEHAQNIVNQGAVTDPSTSGVICEGTETNIKKCERGDRAITDGVCDTNIRLSCELLPSSTDVIDHSSITTEIETTGAVDSTAMPSDEKTEKSSTNPLPSQTPSTDPHQMMTSQTLPGAKQRDPFLGGSGLYIFIGGVGAIVLAIMILVQILLTCWCCFRFRTKGVSPSDMEKQGDSPNEEEPSMQVDGHTEVSTNIGLGLQEQHQLQQVQHPQVLQQPQVHHLLQQSSPNSSVGPIYEPIGSGNTSSMHSQDAQGFRQLSHSHSATREQQQLVQPDGFYSELGKTDVYAQIEPHIARPQESPLPLGDESQYQFLQHKTSSLKREPRPPVHAVNATALAVERGLPEREIVALAYESPLPRKGSIQTPQFERGQGKPAVQHPADCQNEDTNIYHTIEPPPDYATLEGIDEAEKSNISCSNNHSVRNNSTSSQDQPRVQSLSKSSISPSPSAHSGSHTSLSSSSSSGHSPLINRAANSNSPLVSRVNNGPRVTNKYSQSPVASKKDIIQQGSPNHPDLIKASDRNEMNTLV